LSNTETKRDQRGKVYVNSKHTLLIEFRCRGVVL